jgi:hypothetical protein
MYQLGQNRFFRLFQGQPIRLRWGGWCSDTHLLHREGWTFFADENYDVRQHGHLIRLAVTSPDTAVTISGVLHMRMEDIYNQHPSHMIGTFLHEGFRMQQYSAKDVFRTIGHEELNSWKRMNQVDILQPTEQTERQVMMRDFKVFHPIQQATTDKEIYIPEESVDDLFNRILQIQYPQQLEIKKGLIMPEKKPIIQAKIFSLAA